MATEQAWHFLKAGMRSASGNEPPWTEGEKRTIKGRLILCENGYHSGRTPWEALQYAQGPVLCQVEISGLTRRDTDKSVSRSRKLLKAVNVERELRLFACDEAEAALNKQPNPDPRSVNAIAVSRRFADGQATDEELDAAWDAAWAAAWDAAWDAAWAAARDAARAAAWAAWAAARDAAWAAARDAAAERFNTRMIALFEGVKLG